MTAVVDGSTLLPQQELLAATILAERRLTGQPGDLLAEEQRPQSLEQAFALQQQVAGLIGAQPGQAVAGWKCLLPTEGKWVVAPIYQQTVCQFPASSCPMWPSTVAASAGLARVEPELALVLAADLPPRATPYSASEVDAAVGSTHLALELIQSRFLAQSGAGFFDQLADGLFNQGLYLGPAIAAAPVLPYAEFTLSLNFADGTVRQHQAVHPNQHARAGLYWLVNFLSAQGIGLQAGQAVITGSYAGVLELPFAQQIQFVYGELGEFALQFVTKTS